MRLQEERFRQLHRQALRLPEPRFEFIGSEVPAAAVGAQEGEVRGGPQSCRAAWWGCY
jgi:hypothetical protein